MAQDKSLPETVVENANAALANATAAVQGVTGNAADLVASATDTAGKVASRVADTRDLLAGRVSDTTGKLAGTLGDTKEKLASRVSDSKDKLSDTTSKLADRVSDTRDKLADTTSRLADRVNETGGTIQTQAQTGLRIVRENPLGLVLSGLAVGFLAGVLAPVTDVEVEKIAPLRDEIVDRAQRAASDVVQHGRSVLEETVEAVTASASKHSQALAEDLQADLSSKKASENDGEAPQAAPPEA